MAFAVEFSDESAHDLEQIFDHLFENYVQLGEDATAAVDHATSRLWNIRDAAARLTTFPNRGTPRNDIVQGVRFITIDNIIYWYDVDEKARRVRILAIFVGGQDHVRHMLVRALQKQP